MLSTELSLSSLGIRPEGVLRLLILPSHVWEPFTKSGGSDGTNLNVAGEAVNADTTIDAVYNGDGAILPPGRRYQTTGTVDS